MSEYNENRSGAAYPISKNEIIRATVLPVSIASHIARMRVLPNGEFEFAEWITETQVSNQVFYREYGIMDREQLGHLKDLIDSLSISGIQVNDDDDDEIETQDRRGIQLWINDEQAAFSSDDQTEKSISTFNSIWLILLSSLNYPHMERAKNNAEHPFPLKTKSVNGHLA